jgi:anti-anti-sigma regulatory factor
LPARKEVQGQGGSLAVARPQPAVREILSVTGLQTWFEVHDTVEAAVIGAGARRLPAFLQLAHST